MLLLGCLLVDVQKVVDSHGAHVLHVAIIQLVVDCESRHVVFIHLSHIRRPILDFRWSSWRRRGLIRGGSEENVQVVLVGHRCRSGSRFLGGRAHSEGVVEGLGRLSAEQIIVENILTGLFRRGRLGLIVHAKWVVEIRLRGHFFLLVYAEHIQARLICGRRLSAWRLLRFENELRLIVTRLLSN